MNWDLEFPRAQQKETYTTNSPKTITSSIHILNCLFDGNTANPIVSCTTTSDLFILFDHTEFFNCKTSGNKGVIYIDTTGSICLSVLSSSLVDCKSTASSSIIFRVITSTNDLSTVRINMLTLCGIDYDLTSMRLHTIRSTNQSTHLIVNAFPITLFSIILQMEWCPTLTRKETLLSRYICT